jgi:hypothetical protein
MTKTPERGQLPRQRREPIRHTHYEVVLLLILGILAAAASLAVVASLVE